MTRRSDLAITHMRSSARFSATRRDQAFSLVLLHGLAQVALKVGMLGFDLGGLRLLGDVEDELFGLLEGVPHLGDVGVFLRLEKPLDYDSVDRQPVDLVFALFAPKDSGVDHLKALALVSRTMRDPGVVTKLRSNTDPAKLHAILTESRAPQAA